MAKRQTLEDRFWSKVNKDGPLPVDTAAEGSCWDWTASRRGGKDADYGQFRVEDQVTKEAHRVAWELENGKVPEGKILGHICRRGICVRPSHIAPMTRSEAGQNRSATSANSKSGVRGVTWNSQAGKWKVAVFVKGHQIHGGYFTDPKLAATKAEELRRQLLAEASNPETLIGKTPELFPLPTADENLPQPMPDLIPSEDTSATAHDPRAAPIHDHKDSAPSTVSILDIGDHSPRLEALLPWAKPIVQDYIAQQIHHLEGGDYSRKMIEAIVEELHRHYLG